MKDVDEWLDEVESILEEKGMSPDTTNDGWHFLHGNGASPVQAIAVMMED